MPGARAALLRFDAGLANDCSPTREFGTNVRRSLIRDMHDLDARHLAEQLGGGAPTPADP